MDARPASNNSDMRTLLIDIAYAIRGIDVGTTRMFAVFELHSWEDKVLSVQNSLVHTVKNIMPHAIYVFTNRISSVKPYMLLRGVLSFQNSIGVLSIDVVIVHDELSDRSHRYQAVLRGRCVTVKTLGVVGDTLSRRVDSGLTAVAHCAAGQFLALHTSLCPSNTMRWIRRA